MPRIRRRVWRLTERHCVWALFGPALRRRRHKTPSAKRSAVVFAGAGPEGPSHASHARDEGNLTVFGVLHRSVSRIRGSSPLELVFVRRRHPKQSASRATGATFGSRGARPDHWPQAWIGSGSGFSLYCAEMQALKKAAGSARGLLGGASSSKVEEFGSTAKSKGKRGSSRSLVSKKEPRRKRNAADDLTDGQIQEFLGAFELFDKDNSGSSESPPRTRLSARPRSLPRLLLITLCAPRAAHARPAPQSRTMSWGT